jgi:nitroreductase
VEVVDAIRARRSVKEFTPRAVTREEVEALLELATLGPNHRMTQPWRFYVLGPRARGAYGEALGARKAKRVEDAAAAAAVRDKVAKRHEALPALVAVALVQDDDPEIREEDYAAVFMGMENLALAAVSAGLGTHIKTGAVMDDPAARAAVGVADGERIVALIEIGEPATTPTPKPRTPARDLTSTRD